MAIRTLFFSTLFISLFILSCSTSDNNQSFISEFPTSIDRIWIGPEYWANPMQDWKLERGKMVCTVLGRNRNVHLLTRKIDENTGDFRMSINVGIIKQTNSDQDWVGFKLGAKGEFNDYRSDAVFGEGLNVGVTTVGGVFIGKVEEADKWEDLDTQDVFNDFTMEVVAKKEGDNYKIKLEVYDDDLVGEIEKIVPASDLIGDLVVVSHFSPGANGASATVLENSAWFKNWRLNGEQLVNHDDYAFGPILFAQHTLSDKILKMTAQLPPVGEKDGKEVALEVKEGDAWTKVSSSSIDKDARTATFKVENWDDSQDQSYRISYQYIGKDDEKLIDTFEGIIKKNPLDKEEIKVAGFTGNNDLGFPNQSIVENVIKHNPDLLFFSGDQIYEGVGGFGHIQKPLNKAMVDYLRKWMLYGWEYRELLRNTPAISIPDDHDVYHGNLWGEGGKKAKETGSAKERQDSGGYKMPADFVRMVERTQTSNLPDPYDPTPVKQGIGVYYTELNYGGLSFAVIEDRKFKSAPGNVLPKEANAINGWSENKSFDIRNNSDVPGAILLGERQEAFLEDWGSNWSPETSMKVLLSQTIFSNVATLPADAISDVAVPKLRILEKGDYPPDDIVVSDMDSDGWPHTPRNRAVDLLRKCFAFHLAGDQHLGSTIHYGIDDWKDGGVAACVPSVSNVWPRRWYPKIEGKNRKEGAPIYTGDYIDGFNNYLTVYAVSNPVFTGKKPSRLYDRATGYGMIKFNKNSRDITIEMWPRDAGPANPGSEPYEGWPIKINQLDNYGRKAFGYLPKIITEGLSQPPVIQVIDEAGENVYTIRAISNEFDPKVFVAGSYKVVVGEPGLDKTKTLENLKPSNQQREQVVVKF